MSAGETDDFTELAVAPHEARELERQVARPPTSRAAGRGRVLGCVLGAQPPREDVLIQAAGLLVGLILKLAPQRLAQQMKLRQRTLPAPSERVYSDQLRCARSWSGSSSSAR